MSRIKQPTVLPPGIVITRCPPATAAATPLRILRAQAEAAAERGESRIPISDEQRKRAADEADYRASEHAAEAYAETFADARHGGASVSDALDEANAVRARVRRERW